MGLFQKSVLKKYKSLQDKKAIEKAFKKYAKYFHNTVIQQNIREIKEEGFHFRIDLVFYNRILKNFVLIDLKIGELKHQESDKCKCM